MKKLVILCISCILLLNIFLVRVSCADDINEEPFVGVFSNTGTAVSKAKLPVIDAQAAIVMDMKSGRVLYEKNAYTKRAMASTTKIMTAIVALENGNLDDMVTVSKRAASIGGSTIDLKEGQRMSLRELMYGLMLNSGNDAAIAIAEHIGGTVENFAQMMNKKAEELGAKDTSFKSPHGLDADGHYTTAYDLALITKYALANPVFSQIVKTVSTSITGRNLYNTNEMLTMYPGADGVKTGYTGKGGRCLVTSVTRGDWRIISVVLNSPTRMKRAQSSKSILDYAFNNYKPVTLLRQGDKFKAIPVIKGIKSSVDVQGAEEICIPLKQDEIDAMHTEVETVGSLDAPVYAGIEVGSIKYMVNDKVIAQSALVTGEDVASKGVLHFLGDIFTMWARLMHRQA